VTGPFQTKFLAATLVRCIYQPNEVEREIKRTTGGAMAHPLKSPLFKREDNHFQRRWRKTHYLADQFRIRIPGDFASTSKVDEVRKEFQSGRCGAAILRTHTSQQAENGSYRRGLS